MSKIVVQDMSADSLQTALTDLETNLHARITELDDKLESVQKSLDFIVAHLTSPDPAIPDEILLPEVPDKRKKS